MWAFGRLFRRKFAVFLTKPVFFYVSCNGYNEIRKHEKNADL